MRKNSPSGWPGGGVYWSGATPAAYGDFRIAVFFVSLEERHAG